MSWSKTAKQAVKDKGFFDKDSDYDGAIGKALYELIDVFSKQGHSGVSAQWVARLFYSLVKHGGHFTKEDSKQTPKEVIG